jgi:hypothetical protein
MSLSHLASAHGLGSLAGPPRPMSTTDLRFLLKHATSPGLVPSGSRVVTAAQECATSTTFILYLDYSCIYFRFWHPQGSRCKLRSLAIPAWIPCPHGCSWFGCLLALGLAARFFSAGVRIFFSDLPDSPIVCCSVWYFLIGEDTCKVKAGLVLSHRIKKLEIFMFKLLSRDNFSNTLARCSVKCLLGLELSFDSLLAVVVSHMS